MFEPLPSTRMGIRSARQRVHQGDQLIVAGRFGEVLRRATELEPCVHGQRLTLAYDLLKSRQ